MSNREIRAWYQRRVSEIAKLETEWSAQGVLLEERARRAWKIRHDARIEARDLMENAAEVEDLRERDRRLYGNPDGPTFEQLLVEGLGLGFQSEEIYARIIRGAQSTSRQINKRFDIE